MANNMEVKGSVIASIPRFVEKHFGKEDLKNWMGYVSEDARGIFSGKIEEDKWYPLKISLIEPMANIAQVFYKWDLKAAAWELGCFSADYNVSTLKKLFLNSGPQSSF